MQQLLQHHITSKSHAADPGMCLMASGVHDDVLVARVRACKTRGLLNDVCFVLALCCAGILTVGVVT